MDIVRAQLKTPLSPLPVPRGVTRGAMTTVAYITNASPNSGVGSRAYNIFKEMDSRRNDDLKVMPYNIDGIKGDVSRGSDVIGRIKPYPGMFGSKSINWIRLASLVRKDIAETRCDIIHATNQTLSFIIDGRLPSVVTVHDIIEISEPQSWFGGVVARYLYNGIKRADHVIAVSEYTAKAVKNRFNIVDENITVIPNGVGAEFYKVDNFEQTVSCQVWRQNLKITANTKVILYVGSEHPRKNLPTALEAFANVHTKIPDTIFIKVGDPGLPDGRKIMLGQIEKLKIRDAVRLVGNISKDDLNALYNLADILVFPSTFEGFGLPPLQAMASGTPVITSNATSLPEVVGDAGIMHDSMDVAGFSQSMIQVLTDPSFYTDLQNKGLARAKEFSWKSAAEAEMMVYKKVLASRQ